MKRLCSIHALICVAALTTTATAHAEPDAKPVRKVRNIDSPWIDRPWEWRYLMVITPNWKNQKRYAIDRDAKDGPEVLDREWKPLFDAAQFFPFNDKWARPGTGISVVLIEFDKDGKVLTPNAFGKPLWGRINRILNVSLAAGAAGVDPRFRFGDWFLGLGDVSTHWAPAICPGQQSPSPFSQTDTTYLYGPAYEIDPYHASVGCREWAYQLYDPGRPYIDVTSYIPKQFEEPDGNGAYIHETLGWARFDDRKPVIGQHDKQWYCLHDCPGGDLPGVIPDITVWAKKNGWPVPKPPTRVPVFPDPPAISGRYP